MNALDFLLIALSTWRLASLLVNEAGPFHVFEKIRDWVIPEGELHGFFPELLSCLMCCSIWMAPVCYVIWLVSDLPLIILAASTVAIVVDKYVLGDK